MTREAKPGGTTVVPVQGASLRGWEENPPPEVSSQGERSGSEAKRVASRR